MSALYLLLSFGAPLVVVGVIIWLARKISVAETIEVLQDAKQVENDMASISPAELEQLRAKWTRK